MKATFIACVLLLQLSGCATSNYYLSNDNQHRYQILVEENLDDALKGVRSADYHVISFDATSLVYSF